MPRLKTQHFNMVQQLSTSTEQLISLYRGKIAIWRRRNTSSQLPVLSISLLHNCSCCYPLRHLLLLHVLYLFLCLPMPLFIDENVGGGEDIPIFSHCSCNNGRQTSHYSSLFSAHYPAYFRCLTSWFVGDFVSTLNTTSIQ